MVGELFGAGQEAQSVVTTTTTTTTIIIIIIIISRLKLLRRFIEDRTLEAKLRI
jgi:hypothetical protein